MTRWAVVLDDPTQTRSYGFVVEADDEQGARCEAARRAIRVDPRGSGETLVGPAVREDQAADAGVVGAVAAYALAAELVE